MSRDDTQTARPIRPAGPASGTEPSAPLVTLLAQARGPSNLLPHLHQQAVDRAGGSCSLLFQHNPRNGALHPTSGFHLEALRTDPWLPDFDEAALAPGVRARDTAPRRGRRPPHAGPRIPPRHPRRVAAATRPRNRSRWIKPPACRDVTPASVMCMIYTMPDEVLLPGLVAIEHTFDVPLDHGDDAGDRITVFARELADPDGRDRPFLVYLQGGPGFEAPRPTRKPNGPGWLDRALRRLPGPDARPAWHRPLDAGRSALRDDRAATGRLSGPFPRRLDRPRCRVDPPRAGRRALECAGSKFRRHVRHHLPIDGAGRSA